MYKKIQEVLIILVICFSLYKILDKIRIFKSNEMFIINMLKDTNYYTKYERKNLISSFVNRIYNLSIKEPLTIIKSSLYDSNFSDEEYNIEFLSKTTKYIEDPNPSTIIEPVVYIYNSHQLENYDNSNYEAYNITPNVLMASYMLKEKLNEKLINTIAEDSDITEYMKLNNWDYT